MAPDLDDYEALREVRNQIEYLEPGTRNVLGPSDAQDGADAAERVVVAVTSWWFRRAGEMKPPRPSGTPPPPT